MGSTKNNSSTCFGKLVLLNVSFFVADDDLSCEELLIGLPVLRHLRIDNKTVMKTNPSKLDGTDCAKVGNQTSEGLDAVGRLFIARNRHVKGTKYNHGIDYH